MRGKLPLSGAVGLSALTGVFDDIPIPALIFLVLPMIGAPVLGNRS